MEYTLIDDDEQVDGLLSDLEQADLVGLDTEFVAEDCYRPDLCLLQLSTRETVYIVDPKSISRVNDIWQLVVAPERKILVHAGREEILFAYRATDQPISNLYDIQVAAGLMGGEYPASYGKLLMRLLGENLSKGETRTDWRKRPLSQSQLEYAALDVLYLPRLYDCLTEQLEQAGRLQWLEDELQRRQTKLIETQRREGWHRLSGIQSMYGKQLSVVRELWLWRERRAEAKNMPARRVLRDDLIVEMARRGWTNEKKISQIRGLHHAGFKRFIPELAECVARGLAATPPETPWSSGSKRGRPPALLQQFLTAAMAYLCRTHNIAPAIVGTSDDVGRLASYWLASGSDEGSDLPDLLVGWRGELIGEPLYEIFSGKRALRVQNPRDEMPLSLCDAH